MRLLILIFQNPFYVKPKKHLFDHQLEKIYYFYLKIEIHLNNNKSMV